MPQVKYNVSVGQLEKLLAIAADRGCSTDDLVAEAIANFLGQGSTETRLNLLEEKTARLTLWVAQLRSSSRGEQAQNFLSFLDRNFPE